MAAAVPDGNPGASANSGNDVARARLSRFWQPRYWPTWVFIGWLRLAAALPWRLVLAFHMKVVGRALWLALRRPRRIVLRNLELCFPDLTASQRQALAKRHFENVGAFFAEIGIAWFGSLDHVARRLEVEGLEHLEAGLANGKGALLLSGHFTTLELCAPFVKTLVPLFAFMYTPRRNALLNEFQHRGRTRAGHASFPSSDVRAMLKVLRRNAAVWFAPDQARGGNSGVLAPFFGEPAMTNTAPSRIARSTGSAVVPFFFQRRDDGRYLVRFDAPLADFPSDDLARDARRLNEVLERFIRRCPEQYFWIHRKFRGRPADLPQAYDTHPSPHHTTPRRSK